MTNVDMTNKYYYYYSNSNSEQNLSDAIEAYNKDRLNTPNLKFVIVSDKQPFYSEDFVSKFNTFIQNLQNNGIGQNDIYVTIESQSHNYSPNEWNKIKMANEFFSGQGIHFGFEDMNKTWTINEVENANSKITDTAKNISALNFSPYEKLLAAYLNVTTRKYTKEDENEHYSQSRSVYGVLNSEKIVCVGYSELLKAIVSEMGDENIKVFKNCVATSEDNITQHGSHSNLIIYIKDEKYGIDGYYYCDPTWDSGHEEKYVNHLNFFMVPLSDIDKIKGLHIRKSSSLKQKKDETSNENKNTTDKEKVYNKKIEIDASSFTSDGFEFSEQFLLDCISSNPDVLRDAILKQEISKAFENSKHFKNRQNALAKMIEIASRYHLEVISRIEKCEMDEIVKDCESTGNFDKFIEFQERMQEKYGKQDDVDYVKKFVDGYIAHFKENYLEEDSYYEKDEIEALRNCFGQTASLIEEKLKEKPEYAIKLRTLDDRRIIELYYEISEDAKNSAFYGGDIDYTLSRMIKIINYGIIAPNDNLNSRLKNLELEELQSLNKIKQMPDIEVVRIALNDPERLACVSDYLIQSSKSIDIEKIAKALKEVTSKRNPWADEQSVEDYVKQIIDANIERVDKKFERTATNSFMQKFNKQNHEQELLNL